MSLETPRSPDDSVVDLAHEADFRLGSLGVSPSSREVTRGGEREALEPRVMQVLVALYRAQGVVVSRDDLIARCWEGRIVGEDAINRAIWRLRKLESEGDFTIQTIPRVGYRLIPASSEPVLPPVFAEPGSPDSVALPKKTPAISIPSRRWLIAGTLTLVGLAGSIAAWLLWPAPRWTVESSRPFISTLALEGEPAFSPDGKMLAYVSGPNVTSNKIYVRNLAGGDGIKITNDAYNDASPSWSSDGARIAYVAQIAGEPCRIMVATVPAGEAREVGRCRSHDLSTLAWQPNSSFLYFVDQRDDRHTGIFRLDLDTGARQYIVEANRRAPRISPDGKLLAYEVGDTKYRLKVRDLTRGSDTDLGELSGSSPVHSYAWSTDSKTLLATSSNGFGSEIVAYPVDGGAPYRIYASATIISHLSASASGMLAVESSISRKNLARASPTPITQPDIIDPAGGRTFSPTFAPDGTLAFLSDRSGTNTIWIMKPGAAPVPLFDGGSAGMGRQNFSPDGTLLAVAITTPEKTAKIKILTPAGASVATIDMPSVGFGLPTWAPDSKGLIVWDERIHRAVRVEVANPAHRTPVAPPDWQGVTIRSNGTFATRDEKPGVWRIDKGIQLLNRKYRAHWGPPIAFLGDDMLIPDFSAAGGPRILAQPLAGGPDRVIAYAPGAEGLHYISKMTVNPKTGEIIYDASVLSDTNIDLLTLKR